MKYQKLINDIIKNVIKLQNTLTMKELFDRREIKMFEYKNEKTIEKYKEAFRLLTGREVR